MAFWSTAAGADASPKTEGGNINGHTNGHTDGHINGNGNGNAQSSSSSASSPVAIIGMSCRFGGDATSPSKLWDLCAAGKDCWTPIPLERFDAKSLYDRNKWKTGRVGCTSEL
jgi:Beta-ketoacyl synthase, N-terminal domain